jgi:Polyketide cyclase / dehydrase and lipid transport
VSRNSTVTRASPDEAFDVLEDAYTYPPWVLGTRRIRRVDENWPAIGSVFHHAIGTSVAELHDSTKMLDRQRPSYIELEVRFRPTGVATVRLFVAPAGDGSRVTLEETPTGGPFAWLPQLVTDPLLALRNGLSLGRFRRIAERAKDVSAPAP